MGYPQSFRRLLIVAFCLVAIPAVVGLIAGAVSVSTLADRSERAVYDAMIETRGGRLLAEAAATLERNARQFAIIGDRDMLETYRANRRVFLEAAQGLAEPTVPDHQRHVLAGIVALEAGIFDGLDPAAGEAAREQAIASFATLNGRIAELRRIVSERIDSEVDALRDTAVQARRLVLSQLVVLLSLIVVLVIGFTSLINRPIRDLDQAIRRLGRGQLAETVQVTGPDDLKELGERLDWMRRELVGLEQEKNRFMREVAHALKTPLTALREGAELIDDGSLGPLAAEQREVVGIMLRNTLELQRLIEGLIQYGRAQFGRTRLKLASVPLSGLIEQAVDPHRLAARAKGLRLEVAVDPLRVHIDETKVKAILDNLLSNAIKHSPQCGCIRLTARHRDGALELQVADEGPGIDIEERARIFDPFVQGRAVASGLVPGSGIGLSIAREHALAHGGNIELVETGHGACFRARLPAQPQ